MILFKNYEGQVVYTTITDLLTGLPIENDTVSAFISKDGGQFVSTTNSVTEITDAGGNGYGVYAVTLTATETNCDVGAVIFTSTLLELSTDTIAARADTVYFQTSTTTPSVSIADGTYGFNTSGFVGSVSGGIGGGVGGNVSGYVAGVGVVGGIDVIQIVTNDFVVDNISGRSDTIINIYDPPALLAGVNILGNLEITGAIKANNISGYSSANTTITGNVAGNLNGNVSGFVSGSVKGNVDGSVGSVTGNVGGNVVGTVASVVGAVGSVTGAVGSVTGNVGGNVVGSVGSVSSATSIITAIKSATYDSISQEKLYEIILAFIANKVTITVNSATSQTISYKKRDGTTEVLSVTVSTEDGSRSSGGTIT